MKSYERINVEGGGQYHRSNEPQMQPLGGGNRIPEQISVSIVAIGRPYSIFITTRLESFFSCFRKSPLVKNLDGAGAQYCWKSLLDG